MILVALQMESQKSDNSPATDVKLKKTEDLPQPLGPSPFILLSQVRCKDKIISNGTFKGILSKGKNVTDKKHEHLNTK